jgi:hypothetical protein
MNSHPKLAQSDFRLGCRRVGKGALLRTVPTRGHVAGASAGSFAHPTNTIRFHRDAP